MFPVELGSEQEGVKWLCWGYSSGSSSCQAQLASIKGRWRDLAPSFLGGEGRHRIWLSAGPMVFGPCIHLGDGLGLLLCFGSMLRGRANPTTSPRAWRAFDWSSGVGPFLRGNCFHSREPFQSTARAVVKLVPQQLDKEGVGK